MINHPKGISTALPESIFKNYLVDDLTAQNAAPSKKFFTGTIEFFEDHNPTTTMTFHDTLQNIKFIKMADIKQFLFQIKAFREISIKQVGFIG